jgi:hypothetical protein
MRSHLLAVAACAGLGLISLATFPANSITNATPAGVRQAADALRLTEAVHCRRYLHRHRNEQGRSRGCGAAPVVTDSKPSSGVVRAGVGVRSSAPRLGAPSTVGRPANFFNPSNPQDRSGGSNRQDMTQPRAFNPQDMR